MAQTIVGQAFETESGVQFQVLADRFFPAGEHDKANGAYLDSVRAGYLISVSYHGYSVPFVTLEDGVAKLVEVKAAGVLLKGAHRISTLLGVAKTRKPVKLERV